MEFFFVYSTAVGRLPRIMLRICACCDSARFGVILGSKSHFRQEFLAFRQNFESPLYHVISRADNR